jgi:hypothetical protein
MLYVEHQRSFLSRMDDGCSLNCELSLMKVAKALVEHGQQLPDRLHNRELGYIRTVGKPANNRPISLRQALGEKLSDF